MIKGSEITVADERMYHLLEHVGTKPNVIYHVKVKYSTKKIIKKQIKDYVVSLQSNH
jgi:hypothetical protein